MLDEDLYQEKQSGHSLPRFTNTGKLLLIQYFVLNDRKKMFAFSYEIRQTIGFSIALWLVCSLNFEKKIYLSEYSNAKTEKRIN